MKLKLILGCLAIGLIATSCKNRNGGTADGSGMESAPAIRNSAETDSPEMESDMEMTDAEMDEYQGRDEDLGVQTIKGKLVTDKGFQPRVEGIFISTGAFEEDGKDWKDRVRELKGKKLELKGMVVRHWCGPMEQCLTQGYMDRMKDVEYLKVLN